jgi:hypothetical protein
MFCTPRVRELTVPKGAGTCAPFSVARGIALIVMAASLPLNVASE